MPDEPLIQRFRKRKLVQWALAYLAGAFVAFQLLDALAEPLAVSTTVQRGILAVILIGFFITLVLAWYHGEKGRQRASGPELLMVAALLVIAGVAVLSLKGRDAVSEPIGVAVPALSEDGRPSVAVLPLDNFSPDPEDAYFANSLHDELTSTLSQVSALRVIARTSVEQYRENRPIAQQIARELGVDFLIEGSALVAEREVRLTVQLIDGNTGEHHWADSFQSEWSVENVISIQSDIIREVARQLRAAITPAEEARLGALPTERTDAYTDYLAGLFWSNRRDRAGLSRGIEYYELAVEKDSAFALAYAGLAESYALIPWYGEAFVPTAEAHSKAKAAAQRALDIDADLAQGYNALASIQMWFDWDWDSAERTFLKAIELNPNYALAHARYAWTLACWERFDEAIPRAYRAMELDPLSEATRRTIGTVLNYARRFDDAIVELERTLEMHPESSPARAQLAISFFFTEQYERVIEVAPMSHWAIRALSALDREAEAFALADLLVGDNADGTPIETRVDVSMALGDLDGAVTLLEQALEAKAPFLVETTSAKWDVLREDPMFREIRRRMGLRP